MHSDGSKKYVSGHSNKVKLEVMKEELGNCLSLSGYMASANVVQKYLWTHMFCAAMYLCTSHSVHQR